ncbi:MAG TPA: hypothetical protein VJ507_02785 [Candidatus Bathyarchaeia archaeon]|nr:hypothetical protein [Candidatus Bathyarchaeia archaeon]
MTVGSALEPIQFPEAPTPPNYTLTIIGTGIAIIIAIAMAVLILLRRHKGKRRQPPSPPLFLNSVF